MTYEVVMARSARRRLAEQLPEAVAVACLEFILGALAAHPERVGTALRAPFEGDFRTRRGEYRIRYHIEAAERRVLVLDVEHRCDAYRS